MNAQLVNLAPIPVLMYRHTGPYEELSAKFDQLWEWVQSQSIPAKRSIGIYYDNPDYVPASQLKSAACIELPLGHHFTSFGNQPWQVGQIAGGKYVTYRHVGPYEILEPIWSQLTKHIEETMKLTISDEPAFEVYVNDASDTPANQLITELYMPVN